MKRIATLTMLCVCIGCSTLRPENEALPVIHPKVFSMVESWLSDMTSPVVTEVNLDAVRENGNQFYRKPFVTGAWTRIDSEDSRGYMRYRILSRQGNSYVVEFQNNGGGSLTTSTRIGFTISHRTFDVEGERKQVQVMRIESIKSNIQPKPIGDGKPAPQP